MKTELNIAVSGLSLNMLDQIKGQIISSLPSDTRVQWVNISEQHIDLLMVNELFFHSSSIQKILSHHVNHYFRLIKVNDNGGHISGDTLSYPVTEVNDLKRWLYDYCLAEQSSTSQDQTAALGTTLETSDSTHLFDEIFHPGNGFIRIFDAENFLALIDTKTDRIWINPAIPMLRFTGTVNHNYATHQFVQDIILHQHADDLYIGLWNILNRSITLHLPQELSSQYFKLDIWPQVSVSSARKELFKLAACFSVGGHIQIVADSLDLSYERVANFVRIAHLLRMGQYIKADEAKFITLSNPSKMETANTIRGFFGKLRKKFGL